jgi:hypothetical protein
MVKAFEIWGMSCVSSNYTLAFAVQLRTNTENLSHGSRTALENNRFVEVAATWAFSTPDNATYEASDHIPLHFNKNIGYQNATDKTCHLGLL